MALPNLRIEAAFGSTWLTSPASMTWTDITSYVLHQYRLEVVRGATSTRNEIDTGTLDVSLKNADRRFEPLYASGAYYPNIKPGTPVRVYVADDGYSDTYASDYGLDANGVWYGTIEKWPQRYEIGNRFGWVPVQGFDGTDKLARAKMPRSVLETVIAASGPVGYWKLNELDEANSGVLVTDSSLSTVRDSANNGYDGRFITASGERQSAAETGTGTPFLPPRSPVDYFLTGEPAMALRIPKSEHVKILNRNGTNFSTTDFSIEGWFKTSSDTSGVIFRYGNGGSTQVFEVQWDGPNARIICGCHGYPNFVASTPMDLDDDQWHHFVYEAGTTSVLLGGVATVVPQVWIDGVKRTGTWRIMYGGADVSAAGTPATATFPNLPSSGVLIGGFPAYNSFFEGSLAHIAIYSSHLSSAEIVEHYEAGTTPLNGQTTDERIGWVLDQIGWPSWLRNFETGRTVLGPATFKPGDNALDYIKSLVATEGGTLFFTSLGVMRFLDRWWPYLDTRATTSQFTFTDQIDGKSYFDFQLEYDTDNIVNTARYTRRDGTEQVAVNEASRLAYGEVSDEQTDLLQATDNEVRARAEWEVATKSMVLRRLSNISVDLTNFSTTDQATILHLDIGDRITVVRNPQGVGTAITLELTIMGIKHDVGEGTHKWIGYLSPVAEASTGILLWDTDDWDDADAVWVY